MAPLHPTAPERKPAIAEQARQLTQAMFVRLSWIDDLVTMTVPTGQEVASALISTPGASSPGYTAVRFAAAMIDGADLRSIHFWGTPIGRAMAWWGISGLEPRSLEPGAVALALGVSRQSLAELVQRGRLVRFMVGPHIGRYSLSSVSDYMKIKYPPAMEG